MAVCCELAGQPLGAGLCADENEQAPDHQCRTLLPTGIPQLHAFQLIFPKQRGDLRSRRHDNSGVPLDLVDQVTRHGGLKRVASDDDVNFGAGPAQEQRRLAGGVAAADNGDRVSTAGLGLHLGGRIVDADALELGQPAQR